MNISREQKMTGKKVNERQQKSTRKALTKINAMRPFWAIQKCGRKRAECSEVSEFQWITNGNQKGNNTANSKTVYQQSELVDELVGCVLLHIVVLVDSSFVLSYLGIETVFYFQLTFVSFAIQLSSSTVWLGHTNRGHKNDKKKRRRINSNNNDDGDDTSTTPKAHKNKEYALLHIEE